MSSSPFEADSFVEVRLRRTDQNGVGASVRFQLRAQDYRGADSVIMTEEQKPDKAADGEVVVYAALAFGSIRSSHRD